MTPDVVAALSSAWEPRETRPDVDARRQIVRDRLDRAGPRKFRLTARLWMYDTASKPTGFAAASAQITLSKDANTYTGKGPFQFFDNKGNSLAPPSPIQLNATRIKFS